MKYSFGRFKFAPFILGILWVLVWACIEFREIAWGTGGWFGEFSFKWYILYIAFISLSLILFGLVNLSFYKHAWLLRATQKIIDLRDRLGNFRWLLWLLVFLVPIYFFQFSVWGIVFQKMYIRILVWIIVVFFLTMLASTKGEFAGWKEFLFSLILTASSFSIAASLKYVNGYPFSLGWSEGNRLWDYSIMFGSSLYDYPIDKKIPVLLDFGRQLVGGLPFIFPGVTITVERFWVGLTLIFPYLMLGMAAFRFLFKNKKTWLILTLWSFLFLKQGPIHPPLVLSAALVALAWGSPLWLSIPLVVGAGYFAQASRFSWVFAPCMWIVMLEFASASFSDRKTASVIWARSATLGISGLVGGFLLPKILAVAAGMTNTAVSNSSPNIVEQMTNSGLTSDLVVQEVTHQPLLWYRLLPNSTYGYGILFALLLAVGPIIAILLYLSVRKIWKLDTLQKLSLILPLLAFLGVGLVASTKIGGGGDLHNLDMFLIGLLFTGVVAWRNGGKDWIVEPQSIPGLIKAAIVFMLVYSSLQPLLDIRSYSYGEDVSWLKTLTDSPSESALGMLPTQRETQQAVQKIQEEVDKARPQGDILFIDQRQLLTFGFITDVPFVPDYEKKLLMNAALGSSGTYFQEFYKDLAAHRFSLIISEPLRTPIQDSTFQFGEENNAWVEWVSGPVLCYYEPLKTLKMVKVQLLIPKTDIEDCSSVIPK